MDKLLIDKINGLPQPLSARFCGGDIWPVERIDVETGLMRVDVVGKLQKTDFATVTHLIDSAGQHHDSDEFYAEFEIAIDIASHPEN